MRFQTTPAFDGDVRRLERRGRFEAFRAVVRDDFIPAALRHVERPAEPWPARLRVKAVRHAPGIWEMTWDWPDGRATFEWVEIDGESGVLWRRVGTHAIFGDP
ncbi:MAG: hypothetical protein QOE65_2633 [Solirubrobacteraceae bacterium]|nr:hypothetical protein [Solirubrobacteraceae bacterium]